MARKRNSEAPDEHGSQSQQEKQTAAERRKLRADIRQLERELAERKDDLVRGDSAIDSVLEKADQLHTAVQKPREQVADAELLNQLAKFRYESTAAFRRNLSSFSIGDFILRLRKKFGNVAALSNLDEALPSNCFDWCALGKLTFSYMSSAPGASTMIGAFDSQPKLRKQVLKRKRREKPGVAVNPQQMMESDRDAIAKETDANMETMFSILEHRRQRVLAPQLINNRHSFSQTVENIFSLSFLVKDGRIALTVDDEGRMWAGPRNQPGRNDLASGKGEMTQFILRLDYQDWKDMQERLQGEEDLMPHREPIHIRQEQMPTTPHRGPPGSSKKTSRNRLCENALGVDGCSTPPEEPESSNGEGGGELRWSGSKRQRTVRRALLTPARPSSFE